MDTSETYVRMCDHPKIQQGKEIKVGDFYFSSTEDKVLISYISHHQGYIVKHPEQWDYLNGRKIIWLPRQDQIQKMIGDFNKVLPMLPQLERLDRDYNEIFTTMEQLWLAFYMHEKHKLKWSGTKWESE